MSDRESLRYLIASVSVLVAAMSAILNSYLHSGALSVVISVSALFTLITLLRFGSPEQFASFISSFIEIPDPREGSMWMDEDVSSSQGRLTKFSDEILKAYPDAPVLVVLFGVWVLVFAKMGGQEFSNQIFGLLFELLGGGVLVLERHRNGPITNIGIESGAIGYLESLWGFTYLSVGFLLQSIAVLA